jgi:DNA-binding response OmpR family regulator
VSNCERILVVDEVSDTAEVLQAVLEPRGLTVNRVSRLDQSLAPSVETRPAVVVLDVESCDEANCRDWGGWQSVPQVIIGTIQLSTVATRESQSQTTAERRYLQKPFQYADLVQAIEALIVSPSRTEHGSQVNT